jgi:hypothetical protein
MTKLIEPERQKVWRACNKFLKDLGREPATIGEFHAAYERGEDESDLVAFRVLDARKAREAP